MKKAKAILLMAMCLLLFSGCMSGSNRVPSETPLPQITDFTEFHAAELRGGQPLPYVTRRQTVGFIIDEQNRLWSFGDNSTGLLGLGFKDVGGIQIVIDQESGRYTVGHIKYPPTHIMDNVVDIVFGGSAAASQLSRTIVSGSGVSRPASLQSVSQASSVSSSR
ncbi:MAG: hypothetical protein R6W96_01900, partial [Clostridia bacterium]